MLIHSKFNHYFSRKPLQLFESQCPALLTLEWLFKSICLNNMANLKKFDLVPSALLKRIVRIYLMISILCRLENFCHFGKTRLLEVTSSPCKPVPYLEFSSIWPCTKGRTRQRCK